jgi:hypothetical protein
MHKKIYYCFYCKKKVKEGNAYAKNAKHIDHVYPKSLFPELEHFPLNQVVSCGDCNRRKGNMIPTRWFTKMQEISEYGYDEVDLNRVGFRISLIVFEGIKAGYIGFYDWPLMMVGYAEYKLQDYVNKEVVKYMEHEDYER